MKKTIFVAFLLSFITSLFAYSKEAHENIDNPPGADLQSSDSTGTTENKKLIITIGETILTASLYDNATAKDFISLLPLTLTLDDYNNTEKISYLPKKLLITGAPDGALPSAGDINYYAPWGNLCIFYRNFRYSDGLISLGKIDGNSIKYLNIPGSVTVTIDILK